MAYVFRFPDVVTDLISSMRDWKLEDVKKKGGTPSRLGLVPFSISNHTAEFQPRELRPCTYWITVRTRYIHDRVWITCLIDNEFPEQLNTIGLMVSARGMKNLKRGMENTSMPAR